MEISSQSPWDRHAPPDHAAPDRATRWSPSETLLELSDEAPDLLLELIQTFQTDTTARLNRLHSLLTTGQMAELRQEAHTIKGSASQMGAAEMAARCQELEAAAMSGQIAGLAERIAALGSQFSEVRQGMLEYSQKS